MILPRGILITENQIVESVVLHLKNHDWRIVQALNTQQQGFDIIAQKSQHKLYVEAKGGTSADSRTNRFGKTFTDNQAKDHIAKAICKISEAITEDPTRIVAIAIPLEEYHWRYIEKIKHLLHLSKIKVFWVDKGLLVTEQVF
jgi:hypothetical protein